MSYQPYPDLDESRKMLQEQVRTFAQEEIAPKASHHDQTGEFPHEIVKKLAEMGLMGMMVPSEWGGSGLDTISYVLALEEISAACASTAVTMSVTNRQASFKSSSFSSFRSSSSKSS